MSNAAKGENDKVILLQSKTHYLLNEIHRNVDELLEDILSYGPFIKAIPEESSPYLKKQLVEEETKNP